MFLLQRNKTHFKAFIRLLCLPLPPSYTFYTKAYNVKKALGMEMQNRHRRFAETWAKWMPCRVAAMEIAEKKNPYCEPRHHPFSQKGKCDLIADNDGEINIAWETWAWMAWIHISHFCLQSAAITRPRFAPPFTWKLFLCFAVRVNNSGGFYVTISRCDIPFSDWICFGSLRASLEMNFRQIFPLDYIGLYWIM